MGRGVGAMARLRLLAGGIVTALLVLWATRFYTLASVLPAADPLLLGSLGDAVVVAFAVPTAGVAYWLVRPALGRR